ncbi:MAG: outer membrane protein transport protein [Saprospiraceae bacterium]|nr:outer membrane protein transport protein [Saprospiraceae bacterium]
MKRFFQQIFIVLFSLSWTVTSATDGYFALGYGAMHKGVAGAGVSMYHVSMIAGNPAGNAFLGKGYMLDIGVFHPTRSFSVIGSPSQQPNSLGLSLESWESETEIFFIPALGANWKLTESQSIGLAIYGNGGMNTDYKTKIFFDESSSATGVDLAQLFGEVTYAIAFTERHAIGISGIMGYQRFEAKGLNAFGGFGMSASPNQLSDNGHETSLGAGFKVGYQGQIMDRLRLGAMWQSKIYMSEFDKYAGLYAEDGDFDVPMSWTAGVSYSVSDDLTVMADFKQILYSGVNAVSNPMSPATLFPGFVDGEGNFQPNPQFAALGEEQGAGFGWEDMNIIKVGAEYSGLAGWQFRAGYSYGSQPIPEEEVLFNILAPGVVEHHIALGFSKELVGNKMIHFTVNHAVENTVNGTNPLDPVQSIDLKMKQWDFNVGVSF